MTAKLERVMLVVYVANGFDLCMCAITFFDLMTHEYDWMACAILFSVWTL